MSSCVGSEPKCRQNPLSLRDYRVSPRFDPMRFSVPDEKIGSRLGTLYPIATTSRFHSSCSVHRVTKELEASPVTSKDSCRDRATFNKNRRRSDFSISIERLTKNKHIPPRTPAFDDVPVQTKSHRQITRVRTQRYLEFRHDLLQLYHALAREPRHNNSMTCLGFR